MVPVALQAALALGVILPDNNVLDMHITRSHLDCLRGALDHLHLFAKFEDLAPSYTAPAFMEITW